MTDIAKMLRGPATVKDDYTAIYLSAKDARRAADYVERLEAAYSAICDITSSGGFRHATEAQLQRLHTARAALQDTTT